MNLMAFQTLRRGVQANAARATGSALAAAESQLRAALVGSGMFGNVEVASTQDADRTLIAMVSFRPGTGEELVEAELAGLWESQVRYRGWDAFAFLTEAGHVELQGATLSVAGGHYLTVHVVATVGVFAEPVPAPRDSREPGCHAAPKRSRLRLRRLASA